MAKVLVVDDDAGIREMASLALEKAGHQVLRAASIASARRLLAEETVALVLCDIYLPGENGLELLADIQKLPHAPKVILMTARGSLETALDATRLGAHDYLAKPFDLRELVAVVEKALQPPPPPAPALPPMPGLFVGSHPSMVEVYKAIARVAPLPVPVLVLGETGTGKELVAKALHQYSPFATGPFVAVNCGAIPDSLLESELFGHKKGAFTDAHTDRKGALASADGGTVFLDEIGEVSPAFQVKLLRFLQDSLVRPLGSDKPIPVRVRVVAATNRDLVAQVKEGKFRADLYYRLAAYEIRLPPLRARASDIPELVEHFRQKITAELGLGETLPATEEVLAMLAQHPWPGNVRELEQVVRRMLINTRGLADARELGRLLALAPTPNQPSPSPEPALTSLEEAERSHILEVLSRVGGNRSQAARLLGIDRKTLARKLKRFGINFENESAGEGEP